jgi:hypothetical protein
VARRWRGRVGRPPRRLAQLVVAGLFAASTAGCGIIVLEAEDDDPDGLDPVQELDGAPDDMTDEGTDADTDADDTDADDADTDDADTDGDEAEG